MSLHFYPNPIVPAEVIGQMRRIAGVFYEEGATGTAYLLASIVMGLVQATGRASFYADTPFGVCPFCGEYEELLKVDDKNYGVCHEHRVYWYLGRSYLPSQNTPDESLVYPPNLLNTYVQAPTSQAFPKGIGDICPCCGRFHIHAPWCLYLREKQQSLNATLPDIAV